MGDLIEMIRQDSKPSQIRRGDLRAYLLSIHAEGLSKSTISSARNAISGAPEFAIDDPHPEKTEKPQPIEIAADS